MCIMHKILNIIKIIRAILILTVISLTLSSCVYFNTYYNAQKYYKLAEKENENPAPNQQVKPQNYNKSIETAAKIPELFPDSKYVDDALLLMGKCYYRVGNFPKAQRKFEELLSNYPQSELIDEALLFKGKSLIENRSFDQARETLSTLAVTSQNKKISREANFALAELLTKEQKHLQAADIYLKTSAANAGNKKTFAEANLKAAESYYIINDFTSAAQCFLKASNYRRFPLETRFDARFKWALCLYLEGDIENSRIALNSILKNQKFFQFNSKAKVLSAEISIALGNENEAETALKKIIEEKPKTEESAHANFILGKIYQMKFSDYNKSEEFYKLVKLEKADSPYADSADVALKILTDWRKIIDRIDSLYSLIHKNNNLIAGIPDTSSAVETIKAPIDKTRELFNKPGQGNESLPEMTIFEEKIEEPGSKIEEYSSLPPDSIVIDSTLSASNPDTALIQDSSAVIDSIARAPIDTLAILEANGRAVEEIFDNRYKLAELLFFQLNSPDTSKLILKTVIDSAQAELVPKSIYLYSHISRTLKDSLSADSLDQLLMDNYPQTLYGLAVCKKHNIPVHESVVDSAGVLFNLAEIEFDNFRFKEAFSAYTMVDSLYPDSPFSPKAIFARAYLAQYEFGQDSVAFTLLQTLADKYPRDTLAVIAQKRTSKAAAPSAPSAPSLQDTTSSQGVSSERIFSIDEVDTPPVCEKDSSALSLFLISNGFYPRDALSAKTPGKAVIALTVDIYGDIYDARIVSEDPLNSGFGQAALTASEELRYTPGKIGSKLVPVRIEQVFIFKIP